MSKRIEFKNPHPHAVQLVGPDKRIIPIPRHATVVLSDWFLRYSPRDLQVVRVIGEEEAVRSPKSIQVNVAPRQAPTFSSQPQRVAGRQIPIINRPLPSPVGRPAVRRALSGKNSRGPIIGHQAGGDPMARYRQALGEVYYPISGDIGVGILSFNRLPCVKRLLESIRQNTDLSRTTIFVSDESTDSSVKEWLRQQADIVLLDNNERLGVAGNSNRLLRCLSRFKYKILLNDDVVILKQGWDVFYAEKMRQTGYHHFCYRQAGVYGARNEDGILKEVGGNNVQTIHDKPHGSIIAFDHETFKTVGYFDERFGIYGMEHVDWSRRVSLSGIQPHGYHDICGSEEFFKIEHTASAVEDRGKHAQQAKVLFSSLPQSGRIYVQPTVKSTVPTISYVVPCRDILGRSNSIVTVINNIKAQRFPCIEIIISEHDSAPKTPNLDGCISLFMQSTQPFIKAAAFNKGVMTSTSDYAILHDADILVPGNYTSEIYKILQSHNGCHIGKQVLYLAKQTSDDVNKNQHVDADNKCERAVDYFVGGSLAMKKSTYMTIGGLDENFVGYGMEDVEFFNRLKAYGSFYDERSVSMVHLWHDRTSDWQACHSANKKYMSSIENIPYPERHRTLNSKLHG